MINILLSQIVKISLLHFQLNSFNSHLNANKNQKGYMTRSRLATGYYSSTEFISGENQIKEDCTI